PGGAGAGRLAPFAERFARAGLVNSLARTVLKLTLPGVPDIYQGTAGWDFSLVDPDNRRPVDHAGLAAALDGDRAWPDLLARWTDGALKGRLTAALLADRAEAPALYAEGDYRPLRASGADAERAVAFARRAGGAELAVAIPRLASRLAQDGPVPLGEAWGDTCVLLPPGKWRNSLDGRAHDAREAGIPARELFADLPVAVLRRPG
ncbi:MAG: 4-alpha-glucanotransferase, partial [Methylobacteriaceae bacterium]|nr:4-alpha-glucanotransferase [Methylobacteriaceae bacterium]